MNEADRVRLCSIYREFSANTREILLEVRKASKTGALEAFAYVSLGRTALNQPNRALNPFALAHQRLRCATRGDSVYIHLAGANHPVDMDKAGIRTARR